MTLERREFVARLMPAIPEALVIAGLGSPAWDLFSAGDRDTNFYLWGAMGGATSMGLGLALAQPRRSVVVITGDGEQLMGLGSLATVALQRPANLTVVVLDNGRYGETGMQRSHTGGGTDLAAVARGCGIEDAFVVERADGIASIAQRVNARKGASFAVVKIGAGEAPRVLPPRDGSYLKNRFRATLGLAPL
ncbi:MAG TPA: thiamine pyrophosphate-dependent enzyme [Usitatibacter sp.]|nr:thiamine pyrophosphate-dependent enzyme [Usitatibacter sp.]